ncbi:hypothetical protein BJV82DRAFT_665036 [Fennellomyces sp. T-0311]|nr:hypothetical protein BJV82DRAFT_665036 [Fennellomyces sp. T-0311]
MATEISENVNDFWSTRFLNAAKNAGMLVGKSKKIDWEALLGHDASNSNVSPENKISKSPTTGTKRSRSATNSKTDSAPLIPSMLTEFENVYKNLTEEQKWKLPDGKFVEDLMYEYGSNEPAHR